MRVYLAHNFAARDYLQDVVVDLETNHGIEVTSRWIKEDLHILKSYATQGAIEDCEDIESADALVLFTDQYAERPGKGKWFEFGYAVGLGLPVFLVGLDTGCVFYKLPSESWLVYRYSDLPSAIQGLKTFQEHPCKMIL